MNTALSWIKAYVPDLSCTDQEYFDAMTLTGTKVEGYERMDKNLEKIVIGQIEKIEKHPDADKLIICQVNVGDRTIQIVTGAPNVKEGDKVPVVLDGGKVAGGHDGSPLPEDGIKIKAGKLRGIESDGMMCSIEELGSSRDMYPEAPENGIYIFDDDVEVGTDAVEALGLHQQPCRLLQHFRHRKRGGCNLQKAVHSSGCGSTRKRRECTRLCGRRSTGYRSVHPLLRKGLQKYQNRSEPEVDAETSGCSRYPANQ